MSGDDGRARGGTADPDGDVIPAHVHGRARARTRGPYDRRSLVTRLPIVVVLAAVLAGAVAVDRTGDSVGAAGDGAAGVAEVGPGLLMPASPASETMSSTWYCAAGTAVQGGMADHTVTILNPTDAEHAATLTVFAGEMAGGETSAAAADHPATPSTPITEHVDLPTRGRVDVRLGDLVVAPLAAAVVEVDGADVAVEHRVAGEQGADAAPCSTFAAPTWHVAWGATTRDARDVVVLFNPFPSDATVDAVFTTEDGRREPVRFQGFPVPGRSVVGVDLGDDVTRSEQVSATFRVRSGRVVVEHLQSFDGSLGTRGLSLTLGVPAAGETWVFADGEASAPAPTTPAPDAESDDIASGSDDTEADPAGDELSTSERIVVYNPGDVRAEVDVSVVPTSDTPARLPQPFRLSVGPGGYEVVDYGAEDRVVAGVPHTTVVRSTNAQQVVAERVTVDEAELTASTGARLAATRWAFASVAVPETDGDTVAFVVFNPDPDAAVEVRLDLIAGAGAGAETVAGVEPGAVDPAAPVEVPPGARLAIELDADAATAAQGAVVAAAGPVVVDRVVRTNEGRRLALGPGVPAAAEAVPLDQLAAEDLLAG